MNPCKWQIFPVGFEHTGTNLWQGKLHNESFSFMSATLRVVYESARYHACAHHLRYNQKVSELFSEHGLKVTQSVPVDHFKFLSL